MLAFADGEAILPITPALDGRLGVSRVLIASYGSVSAHALGLGTVALADGRDAEVAELPPLAEWPRAAAATTALLRRTENLVINLSGAPPLLAALVTREAVRRNIPVFAVEPVSDQLHWIVAPPDALAFDVADRVTLDGYFTALGYTECTIRGAAADTPAQPDALDALSLLTARIAFSPTRRGQPLWQPRGGGFSDERRLSRVHPDLRAALLAGGFARSARGESLDIESAEVLATVRGGWFERWVYRVLFNAREQLGWHDLAWGITLYRPHDGLHCEFDVAMLRNNALHLIECKVRLGLRGVDRDDVFKLAALGEHTDLAPRAALLVTTERPGEGLAERARQFDVQVLGLDPQVQTEPQARAALLDALRAAPSAAAIVPAHDDREAITC